MYVCIMYIVDPNVLNLLIKVKTSKTGSFAIQTIQFYIFSYQNSRSWAIAGTRMVVSSVPFALLSLLLVLLWNQLFVYYFYADSLFVYILQVFLPALYQYFALQKFSNWPIESDKIVRTQHQIKLNFKSSNCDTFWLKCAKLDNFKVTLKSLQ